MSNELIRKSLETSLTLGGLKDLVKASETVMLLIDTSGSMSDTIRTGKRRIDGLRDVVRDVRAQGHVPMIAFGGPYDAQVRFVDSVPEPDGGTPLHVAIPFAKEYGATRLVVISDGMPDLPEQCNLEAKSFGGQIDVVFIGNPGEMGSIFLDNLAKLTGGKRFEGDIADTKKLTGTVIGLLGGDVQPARGPIQGPGFTASEADPDEDGDFEDDDDESDDDDDEDEDAADEDDE